MTAVEVFREIDRLTGQLMRTGPPSDAVELWVVDANHQPIQQPRRAVVSQRSEESGNACYQTFLAVGAVLLAFDCSH